MKKLLFLLSLLIAIPAAPAETLKIQLPVPEVETLPNGLQLVWFVSDRLPVVDLELLFRSGNRADPPGKTGTSALVAESLERGAGGMNAQQISKAVEELGASRAESADDDTFSLGMHGLAPDAPTLLKLIAALALKPEFPPAEVAREHARLLERWTHLSDYGESLVSLLHRKVITAGTSYGRGGFLSAQEFSRVTRDDVVAWWKKHFVPGNATLMVVGRVDRKAFRAQIDQLFGGWTGQVPKDTYINYSDKALAGFGPKARAHAIPEVLIVNRPGLTQAEVRMGFRAPSITDPRHYALVLANAMLGEYFNSRLNALIRDKLGLTYGIGSSFSYSKDLSTFSIASATANESVGPLITKTLGVLKQFKSGPIPADEVQMAREYVVGGFPLRTATLGSVASAWLTASLFGLPLDYVNQFVPKISAVTPEQVQKAVADTFDLGHMTVAIAGDARAIEESLKAEHIAWKVIPIDAMVSGVSAH